MLKKIWNKWKKVKKRWKVLLVLGLIVAAIIIWSNISAQRAIEANREVVPVTRETLVKEAVRTGQIELQGVTEVTPPVSGVISELLVQNGSEVAENQVLFKVKADLNEADQAAAWATYLAAKNAYEDSKYEQNGESEWAEFETAKMAMMAIEEKIKDFEDANPEKVKHDNWEYQQLKLEESITRRKLNQEVMVPSRIEDRQKEAKANYLAASAAYNASKDGTYRSPVAGRIENLGVNEGENVTAGVEDKEGTPLFLIVPAGKKTVSMQIGPNDANILEVGQQATVKSEVVPEETFSAKIARIDKVGKSNSEKGLTYRAWLELDDNEDRLLLGLPVDITIQTGMAENALVVPSQAVVEGMVTVVDEAGEVLEVRPVETGLKALGQTEIVSGLNEGELVLVDHNAK